MLIVLLAAVFAIVALLSLVVAWPFMWIWNYAVVSALTVANPINYWVAFWLMVFFTIFVAGIRADSSRDN